MTQQIFFLHSAGPQGPHEGSSDFIAWLKKELEPDFELLHPMMPHPDEPDYGPWKGKLKGELARLQGDLILMGHSLGSSVLLKYLAEERLRNPVRGMFLVATPFWGGDSDFALPKNFGSKLPEISDLFFYQSKDDPVVPLAHVALYAKELPRATVRVVEGNEHEFKSGLPQLVADLRGLSSRR